MTTSALHDVQTLQKHLRARASTYFPELAGHEVSVDLTSHRKRRYSQTFHFVVRSSREQRHIFAKMPLEASSRCQPLPGASADRPRLVPLLAASDEARLEYAALTKLASHFHAHSDERLGVPRVFDLLDGKTIIAEALHLPTLDKVLTLAARWRSSAEVDAVATMLRASGAWLGALHTMLSNDTEGVRLGTRDEFLQRIDDFTDYLREATRLRHFLGLLQNAIHQAARAELPLILPLAVGHGDFGLHNLFVTPSGGIIGFDSLACWQVPPEEDLAYFLLLLETMPPLFVSRTWMIRPTAIAAFRREFLHGYYGEDRDAPAGLLLFEMLVTLDKWASVVQSCRRAHGLVGMLKHTRLALQQRLLYGRLRRQLDQLEQCSQASTDVPEFVRSRRRV